MSLNAGTILVDGTPSVTGGTSTAFASKGATLNKHNLFLDDGAILLDQVELQVTTKEAKVQASAPNGYTQARVIAKLLYPLNLDNGARTVNTITLEMATDVETTDAEKLSMRVAACQLLFDSDFTELWDNLSVA